MPKSTKLGDAFKGMLSTCPGEVCVFGLSVVFALFPFTEASYHFYSV